MHSHIEIEEKGSELESVDTVSLSNFSEVGCSDFLFNAERKKKSQIDKKVSIKDDKNFANSKEHLGVIKMVMVDQWVKSFFSTRAERIRVYQVWPGRNVMFFLTSIVSYCMQRHLKINCFM